LIVPDLEQTTIFDRLRASGRIFEPWSLARKDHPEMTADVVVVGTGAGGSAVFRELALAGVDVLALEAGDLHMPHLQFDQRENTMLQRLFWHGGARSNRDLTVTVTHGRGVGGSTVHNTCLIDEPPAAVLDRWANEYGVQGWTPERLAPVFARVRRMLHVEPMPAEAVNRNNSLLEQGAEALGWHSRRYEHNRVACLQCGYCTLGCTYNRKQSALLTYVPAGVLAGGRLIYGARARRVWTSRGKQIEIDTRLVAPETGGRIGKLKVKANTLVLAGSAIHTPAILLRSGLGDPYGFTGQGLRLHPASPVAARFARPVDGWTGIPQTSAVDEWHDGTGTGHSGFLIMPVFGHPGATAATIGGNAGVMRHWLSHYRYLAAAAPMVHDETSGRIRMHANEPEVVYDPIRTDRKGLMWGLRRTAELFLAAGAKEVLIPTQPDPYVVTRPDELARVGGRWFKDDRMLLNSVHPQGTVRMADDPRKGVVDSRGAHHHHDTIWVADGSLFPTSLGAPPQLTIYAAGTLVAREILRSRSRS